MEIKKCINCGRRINLSYSKYCTKCQKKINHQKTEQEINKEKFVLSFGSDYIK